MKLRPCERLSRCGWGLVVVLLGGVASSSGCGLVASGQNAHGVRLYQQGQYQGALQQFQQALTSDRDNADALYNMARTFHQLGVQNRDDHLLNQSEVLYNQCLDVRPDHVECHRGLAVLLADTGRTDRAFNLLKNWVALNPQLGEAYVELARLAEETGDVEASKTHLETALRVDHHNARAWAAMGSLREKLGETSQALANYQRSFELNRMQPQVQSRIAALSRAVGGYATPPNGTRTVTTTPPTLR